MKTVTILSLLLLASPVFAELTKEDMRTIIKEEMTASEKRIREYIDLKIETVNARIDALDKSLNARIDATNARIDATHARIDALNKSFDRAWVLILALIGLITAAIAIPQIIIAYKDSARKEMQAQIDQLRDKVEAMNQ